MQASPAPISFPSREMGAGVGPGRSNGSGDAVLRTDADHIEHANEMGTSELH